MTSSPQKPALANITYYHFRPVTSNYNGPFHFEVYETLAILEFGTMFLLTVEASTVLGSSGRWLFSDFRI